MLSKPESTRQADKTHPTWIDEMDCQHWSEAWMVSSLDFSDLLSDACFRVGGTSRRISLMQV